MMASTARIIWRRILSPDRMANPVRKGRDWRSLAAGGLGHGPVGGELQLGPAARAEGVVERDDAPTAGARAPRLVVLVARQQRRQQPEDGQDGADHEPEHERRPLDA